MCVAGWLGAVGQIFYLSQICRGVLDHYCLSTVAGLLYFLHTCVQWWCLPWSPSCLMRAFKNSLRPSDCKKSEDMSQMYAKSQKSVIKPGKQSEKTLSFWHVMGIPTNTWRLVMWKFWGSVRGVWCVNCTLSFCIFPFPLLPSKTLAVLESPWNDVAIKEMIVILLQAVLGIVGKTGYKKRAKKKIYFCYYCVSYFD